MLVEAVLLPFGVVNDTSLPSNTALTVPLLRDMRDMYIVLPVSAVTFSVMVVVALFSVVRVVLSGIESVDIRYIPETVEVAGISIGLLRRETMSCADLIPTPAMKSFRLGDIDSVFDMFSGRGAKRKEDIVLLKVKEFLPVPPNAGIGFRSSFWGMMNGRDILFSVPGVKEEEEREVDTDGVWEDGVDGVDGVDGGGTYLEGGVNGT